MLQGVLVLRDFWFQRVMIFLGYSHYYKTVLFIKVSKFRSFFLVLQFHPKNKRRQVNLRFYSSKVEFIHLFFGRKVDLKKLFWLFLIFRHCPTECATPIRNSNIKMDPIEGLIIWGIVLFLIFSTLLSKMFLLLVRQMPSGNNLVIAKELSKRYQIVVQQ